MYEEAASHLDLDVTDDGEECRQAGIVQADIRKQAIKFYMRQAQDTRLDVLDTVSERVYAHILRKAF